MESGLSTRMARSLHELRPKSAALAPSPKYNPSTAIDLSNGQNEVLRRELLDFFASTVEDKLSSEHFSRPPSDGGDSACREALASFFNTYFHPIHPVRSEHIVVTAGASDALESLIYAICDDGDSVIVPGPYWHGFDPLFKTRTNVNTIVARPPTYHNYDNYLMPSLLAAYNCAEDRERIKAVVICNPHNPLARCYPRKEIVECMEFCQERGLHLISDEVFALASLQDAPDDAPAFASALSLTEPLAPEGAVKIDPSRVHVVWSASKLFGSSGLRVGCFISQQNPQLCTAMGMLTAAHTNNIATLYLSSLLNWSQLPTLLALNSERLTASYRLLAQALRQWNVDFVTPTHGIFVFAKLGMKVRSVVEEKAYFNRLAVQGVRISPGRFYNGVELEYGWARIRFSVSIEVMVEALKRIAAFLAKEDA
ncbi:PLP-dependent transferase [Westerdykella ornata]|uniref:PLP-dependent transferase n=1 Tax=Westerdykella ornata TaxID=318751 RepID=A0A6A6JQ52_WESOR|nr:PLP-dependent transferase [Westerdykella ornata]KAF2278028.1 PLP-dependent transferase [Westerdykella ornata]